ncbi:MULTISPECIES: hypothetical protein [Bacillaceae]|uniref:Uncharacterized protein n=1 Tax=Domibacillus aminovorans TaxID=29332 RepID=A0A177KYA0_9BACI|nr:MULTISPECIES: hypothetical protein [Bacillaceae]OAH57984.1 hypothetical protein AWH48_02980 [Domibacillus aminovorans]
MYAYKRKVKAIKEQLLKRVEVCGNYTAKSYLNDWKKQVPEGIVTWKTSTGLIDGIHVFLGELDSNLEYTKKQSSLPIKATNKYK